MRQYTATYRIDTGKPGMFSDVTLTVDHLPIMGSVVAVPDGSERYGLVISVERVATGISSQQLSVLRKLSNGLSADSGLHGRSERGGLVQVLSALRRRGLIDQDGAITDIGTQVAIAGKLIKGQTHERRQNLQED